MRWLISSLQVSFHDIHQCWNIWKPNKYDVALLKQMQMLQ